MWVSKKHWDGLLRVGSLLEGLLIPWTNRYQHGAGLWRKFRDREIGGYSATKSDSWGRTFGLLLSGFVAGDRRPEHMHGRQYPLLWISYPGEKSWHLEALLARDSQFLNRVSVSICKRDGALAGIVAWTSFWLESDIRSESCFLEINTKRLL